MDATTIRSISIVGACILGTFLFVKGSEMKESLGSCTMVSKPKCEPYTRQGGCPYTRENMRCHIKLNCNKVAYVQVRIDLSRYNNAVNAISLIK